MCTREKIIAVDFDGCLCENAWPDIGEAKQDVIDALLLRQKRGSKIILWTCRVGERLDAAVQWCADHGITFDAVNKNLPSMITTYGNDCRKVYADEYWDDKAVLPEPFFLISPDGERSEFRAPGCSILPGTEREQSPDDRIDTDQGPMLHIFPNDSIAREESYNRVAPILKSEPVLPPKLISHKDDGIMRFDSPPDCFLETPINPDALGLLHAYWNPKEYPGNSPIVPTDAMSMRSETFVFLREVARMFYNGTAWNKKARIVLEYDPDKPKVQIRTFMERDEAIPVGDRQWVLRAAGRRAWPTSFIS